MDGVQGNHSINQDPFWSDFLIMLGGIGCFVSSFITLLIFFPRSLTQELGYTTALILPPMVNKSQITVPDGRHVSPKHVPVTVVRSTSAHPSEFSQGEDTTPEYEPEDSANITHTHSYDGHTRMRRQTWEQTQDEGAPPADGQYLDTPYMFDRHSGCLVRSHSDGLAIGLHPYVRTFRSPIDICDLEDDDHPPV